MRGQQGETLNVEGAEQPKGMLGEKGLLKILKLFATGPRVCHALISLFVTLSVCWYWPLCSLVLFGEHGFFWGDAGLGLLLSVSLVSYR